VAIISEGTTATYVRRKLWTPRLLWCAIEQLLGSWCSEVKWGVSEDRNEQGLADRFLLRFTCAL
jgi:hypothetical protein